RDSDPGRTGAAGRPGRRGTRGAHQPHLLAQGKPVQGAVPADADALLLPRRRAARVRSGQCAPAPADRSAPRLAQPQRGGWPVRPVRTAGAELGGRAQLTGTCRLPVPRLALTARPDQAEARPTEVVAAADLRPPAVPVDDPPDD